MGKDLVEVEEFGNMEVEVGVVQDQAAQVQLTLTEAQVVLMEVVEVEQALLMVVAQ